MVVTASAVEGEMAKRKKNESAEPAAVVEPASAPGPRWEVGRIELMNSSGQVIGAVYRYRDKWGYEVGGITKDGNCETQEEAKNGLLAEIERLRELYR